MSRFQHHHIVLPGATCCLIILQLLCAPTGGEGHCLAAGSPVPPPQRISNEQLAAAIAQQECSGYFEPSLETKEAVDFLLTPALLAQEALSTGVVLTYPSSDSVEHSTAIVMHANQPSPVANHSPSGSPHFALGAANIEPVGTAIGPLCFDATLRLNTWTARSPIVLFVRYWVSSDYYVVSVLWGEPNGIDLPFPIYPSTLVAGCDSNTFYIQHGLYPQYNAVFSPPIGRRGPFHYLFGDYAIHDIRYAQEEALQSRFYATVGGHAGTVPVSDVLEAACQSGRPAEQLEPDIRQVRIDATNGLIQSLTFLDQNGEARKQVAYFYATSKGRHRLQRMVATLKQEKVVGEFLGEGLTVKLNGHTYRYHQLELAGRLGGRTCRVGYEECERAGRTACLPVSVDVLGGKSGRRMLSAALSGYRFTTLPSEQAKAAALRYSSLSPDEIEYWELLKKYWRSQSADVTCADGLRVKRLLEHFRKEQACGRASTGKELRTLNILMELCRLEGDTRQLVHFYNCYLSLLKERCFSEMILDGGSEAVMTSVIWGRWNEADCLLHAWLAAVVEDCGIEDVLHFSKRRLDIGRVWTTFQLVGQYLDQERLTKNQRLKLVTLQCLALDRMRVTSTRRNAGQKMELNSEAKWMDATVDSVRMRELTAATLDKARGYLNGAVVLTKEEAFLKDLIDRLERECR